MCMWTLDIVNEELIIMNNELLKNHPLIYWNIFQRKILYTKKKFSPLKMHFHSKPKGHLKGTSKLSNFTTK